MQTAIKKAPESVIGSFFVFMRRPGVPRPLPVWCRRKTGTRRLRHIPQCVRLHIPACSSCCAPPLVFDGFIIPENEGNKADLLRRCHSICWRNIRFLRKVRTSSACGMEGAAPARETARAAAAEASQSAACGDLCAQAAARK